MLPITARSSEAARLLEGKHLNAKKLKQLFFLDDEFEEDTKKNKAFQTIIIYSGSNASSVATPFAHNFGQQSSSFRGKRIAGDDLYLNTAIAKDPLGVTFNALSNVFDLQSRHLKSGLSLVGLDLKKDLANRVWHRKNQLFQGNNISFVACSKWLEGLSRKSALLRGQEITNIPNTIDTHVFCRKDKQEARTRVGLPTDKRIILFVSQRVTDRRKGMDFMIEAIDRLVAERPEMKENTVIAIMGGHSENFDNHLALPVYALGYIHEEKKVADVYNSADVFVLPSLEDNLPNTIMEALACGVPSVGFKVGGIPEEIDHEKNGYVAKYRDSLDLAHGIYWCLCEADYQMLSDNAIKKVTTAYSQRNVALKYIEVYNQALATKNYNI